MRRGRIWRVRLPSGEGHVQAGERPAVIVQNDSLTLNLPTILVVPFTGTLATLRYPGTLRVDPDGTNGLTIPSVALVFQLRALDPSSFLQQLGDLDTASMAAIESLIRDLTS